MARHERQHVPADKGLEVWGEPAPIRFSTPEQQPAVRREAKIVDHELGIGNGHIAAVAFMQRRLNQQGSVLAEKNRFSGRGHCRDQRIAADCLIHRKLVQGGNAYCKLAKRH